MTEMNSNDDSILQRLRELMAVCGPNKNDSGIVLTSACIDEGVNGGSKIISMLVKLGFDPQHIGLMLHHNTGSNPERYYWYRDEANAYCNHNVGS